MIMTRRAATRRPFTRAHQDRLLESLGRKGLGIEQAGAVLRDRTQPVRLAERGLQRRLNRRFTKGMGPTDAGVADVAIREQIVADYLLSDLTNREIERKYGLRDSNGMNAWRVVMRTVETECGIAYSETAMSGKRGKERMLRDAFPILCRVWARSHPWAATPNLGATAN